MSWQTARGFCWDRAVRMLGERLFALMVSVAIVSLALALLVGGFMLTQTVAPVVARLPAAEATVYVAPGAAPEEIKTLSSRLEAIDGVARVRLVPREQAWAELQRRARDAQPFAEIKPNPLPDALVVEFVPRLRPALVAAAVTMMGKLPRAESVQGDIEWYRRLMVLVQALADLLGPVVLITALLAVVVTIGLVRRFAVIDAAELRLLDQIGAEEGFIRRPFVYAGTALLGLAAAGGLGLVAVGRFLANPPLGELARTFGVDLTLGYPPWPLVLAFVAGSLLFGAAVGYYLGGRQVARVRGLP
jgi:cell division transport system permease protein